MARSRRRCELNRLARGDGPDSAEPARLARALRIGACSIPRAGRCARAVAGAARASTAAHAACSHHAAQWESGRAEHPERREQPVGSTRALGASKPTSNAAVRTAHARLSAG